MQHYPCLFAHRKALKRLFTGSMKQCCAAWINTVPLYTGDFTFTHTWALKLCLLEICRKDDKSFVECLIFGLIFSLVHLTLHVFMFILCCTVFVIKSAILCYYLQMLCDNISLFSFRSDVIIQFIHKRAAETKYFRPLNWCEHREKRIYSIL